MNGKSLELPKLKKISNYNICMSYSMRGHHYRSKEEVQKAFTQNVKFCSLIAAKKSKYRPI